jgi:hypothetical protein
MPGIWARPACFSAASARMTVANHHLRLGGIEPGQFGPGGLVISTTPDTREWLIGRPLRTHIIRILGFT